MDKVMFWKKGDDSGDIGGDLGSPFSNPPGGEGFPQEPDSGGLPPGAPGMPPIGNALGESGLGTQGADHLGLSSSGLPPPEENPFIAAPSLAASPNQPQQEMPRLQPAPLTQPSAAGSNKDFEVISAKLDSIRASIDSLNIRVESIESVMRREHEKKQEIKW